MSEETLNPGTGCRTTPLSHDDRPPWPRYLRIVLTTGCPLRCEYCHLEGDTAGQGHIDVGTLEGIVKAGLGNGIRKVKFMGGEPLLYPSLVELVYRIKRFDPTVDTSVITSGVADTGLLDDLFRSGLDRVNVSLHGFSWEYFRDRPGDGMKPHTRKQFEKRGAFLDRILDWGRPTKLNYVYRGECDDEDLSMLLDYASKRGLLVNVLDDLASPSMNWRTVLEAVRRLHGHEQFTGRDEDPNSLSTLRLSWADGLRVEIKDQLIGSIGPWRHCDGCPKRGDCREGIFALRLMHDGVLRACKDRDDIRFDIAQAVKERGVGVAANKWRLWLESIMRTPDGEEERRT